MLYPDWENSMTIHGGFEEKQVDMAEMRGYGGR